MILNQKNKLNLFLLILTCFSLAIFSCKKEKDVPESFISYEVNGITHSYQSKTELTFQFVGWIQTSGKEKPSDHLQINAPNLIIQVKDHGTVISTGEYSGKTYYSNGFTKEVFMTYKASNGNGYQPDYNNHITEITINSINREGVKGKFSGILVNSTLQGADTMQITNGDFSIYTYK